jgi:hypothetical protein
LENIMSDRFESLESGEVVSIEQEAQVLSGQKTFKTGDLNEAIESYLASAIPNWNEAKKDWFTDRGIDCEALRFGSKGWQKGRIRLSLEFCPDESDLPAIGASNSSIPTAVNSPQPTIDPSVKLATPPVNTVTEHYDEPVMLEQSPVVTTPAPDLQILATEDSISLEPNVTTTASTSPTVLITVAPAIPVATIATASTVAAVAAIASPELQTVGVSQTIPHLTDAVLEPEHQDLHSAPHDGGFDEIAAFEFGVDDNDRGRMIPNGMMELDLSDGMDFSEHDLLSFEANGLSDAADGFGDFQDLEACASSHDNRPENSGMLIDEVWNETSHSSWPKIS